MSYRVRAEKATQPVWAEWTVCWVAVRSGYTGIPSKIFGHSLSPGLSAGPETWARTGALFS